MKKIVLIISLSLLGLLTAAIIISGNKNVTSHSEYYAIPQIYTYKYEKDKRIKFNIYSTDEFSLIEFPDSNQYYLTDGINRYQLNNITVQKKLNSIVDVSSFYVYIIEADIISLNANGFVIKDCNLEIENEKFSLVQYIGYYEVISSEHPYLEFTDLYGNYTYINNELYLIGITVRLSGNYDYLGSISLGSAFGNLDFIEENKIYDSQRNYYDLKNEVVTSKKDYKVYRLKSKSIYYYFPISYEKLMLVTDACIVLKIDGINYCLDDFCYLASDIRISDYQTNQVKGTILYA